MLLLLYCAVLFPRTCIDNVLVLASHVFVVFTDLNAVFLIFKTPPRAFVWLLIHVLSEVFLVTFHKRTKSCLNVG